MWPLIQLISFCFLNQYESEIMAKYLTLWLDNGQLHSAWARGMSWGRKRVWNDVYRYIVGDGVLAVCVRSFETISEWSRTRLGKRWSWKTKKASWFKRIWCGRGYPALEKIYRPGEKCSLTLIRNYFATVEIFILFWLGKNHSVEAISWVVQIALWSWV